MKSVLGVLLGLACGVGLWLIVESRASHDAAPRIAALEPDSAAPRLADLEGRLASVESALHRLEFALARDEGSTRAPGTTTFVAPPTEVQRSGDGVDPRWYLEQYARSFDAGGEGSEYFRLAVDAFAMSLTHEIADLVRDGAAHASLRVKLAGILGTPRFARDARAIDALLALLRNAATDRLAIAALDGLRTVGDAQTGVALERLVWGLATADVQKRALLVLVHLFGPDANRALQRLFAAATTTEQRTLVIAALSTADPEAALDVFRQSSTLEDAVRLNAASAIGKFRGEPFAQFIDAWLGYESDARVRQILGETRGLMNQVQPYAAQKATGPPDANPDQDHPNAWATQSPDMGVQWIELGYAAALRANAVRIHEVNVPGAVVQVFAIDEAGGRHELWAGVDPTPRPGVFEIGFATTKYRVKGVRIVIDTNRLPGWSEIDAVELVGPDGSAWAASATASSSYGQ